MAQTKRKRRTKHRGNAAGSIEARGRTGRKPTEEERRKLSASDARQERRELRAPPLAGAVEEEVARGHTVGQRPAAVPEAAASPGGRPANLIRAAPQPTRVKTDMT